MFEAEREVGMDEDFNENDPNASLICYSPSRRFPSPEPGFSQWISSNGNASSSALPLVRSPSTPFRARYKLIRFRHSIGLIRFCLRLNRFNLKRLEDLDRFTRQQLEVLDRFTLLNLVLIQGLLNDLTADLIHAFTLVSVQGQGQQLKALFNPLTLVSVQESEDLDGLDQELDNLQFQFPSLRQLRFPSVRQLGENFNASLRQQLKGLLDSSFRLQLKLVLVQELDRLPNQNRKLHKFIQHASQITLQMKIKCAPNGLPDGEKMLRQDSQKHQLVGETHATNDGENVPSEGGIHSAVSYPENEGTRKTAKRKTTLEGLQHFSGSRKDAAKHFKVSESTIKRCLRDHNINDWRNRKIDKNNQCLSEPKDIIESFQGEGADMGNQMAGGSRSCERKLNYEQIGFPPASKKGSNMSQIGVGLIEKSSTQLEITHMGNMFASSTHEQYIEVGDHSELHVQHLRPDAVNSTLPPIPEGELLTENSGRLRELSDHYISATEAFTAKQVPDSSQTNLSCSDPAPKLAKATTPHMMPLVTETQGTKTVTMKATYREDMIRFRLPLTPGIIELRKEVAERLMLVVGTFSIKYLDDDEDWILMTSDKDLQECFNISVSLGCKVIKLSIHDITPSKGELKRKLDCKIQAKVFAP